ncbi:MAG: hypothetical protein OEY20_04965, partial [Gemmatimonadota bacterium]|nr:hypothetical protein [Gemmatimonadota bacterium]
MTHGTDGGSIEKNRHAEGGGWQKRGSCAAREISNGPGRPRDRHRGIATLTLEADPEGDRCPDHPPVPRGR